MCRFLMCRLHRVSAAFNHRVRNLSAGEKQKGCFPKFAGWLDDYGAFTYTWRHKEQMIRYVADQEAHRSKEDFVTEYLRMPDEAEIDCITHTFHN